MKYLASCSFGKDSVATVITAMLHNEPLHELVYCEVMFDDNGTSAEIPEHAAFIHDVAIPELRGWGIKTNIIRSDKNFLERFNHVVGSGPHTGKCWAWPLCGRCYVQRDLKVRPIQRWKRTLGDDVVQYIGIEADEQERLLRLDGVKHISLLQKYGVTKDKVFDLCTRYGLLSPIYAFTDRGVLFLPQCQRGRVEAPLPAPPRPVAVVDAVTSYTEQDHGALEPKRNIFRGERADQALSHLKGGHLKYIASCSFGKDSMATVLLALAYGEPLDAVMYVRVMYDDVRSAEPPEHEDFIQNVAIPLLGSLGVPVVVLQAKKTFKDVFLHVRTKGNHVGKRAGFPMQGKCEVSAACKRPCYNQALKLFPGEDVTQYVGIAIDEPRRLSRLKPGKVSLLAKYGYTEAMAEYLCFYSGLLSPMYTYANRGGAFSAQTPETHPFRILNTTTRTSGQICENWLRPPT